MTLPPKGRRMPRSELIALTASGEWGWRCADTTERHHPDWRVVEMLVGGTPTDKPIVFVRVPAKGAA